MCESNHHGKRIGNKTHTEFCVFVVFYRPSRKGKGNIFTGICLFSGGSLYDVTTCLAAWSHVPSRGLCTCSFQGVSL